MFTCSIKESKNRTHGGKAWGMEKEGYAKRSKGNINKSFCWHCFRYFDAELNSAMGCVLLQSAIGATYILHGYTKGPLRGARWWWLASCMDGMMGSHSHDWWLPYHHSPLGFLPKWNWFVFCRVSLRLVPERSCRFESKNCYWGYPNCASKHVCTYAT